MSSSDIVAQFFDRAKYLYATSPKEPEVTAQSAGLEWEVAEEAVARRRSKMGVVVVRVDGFIVCQMTMFLLPLMLVMPTNMGKWQDDANFLLTRGAGSAVFEQYIKLQLSPPWNNRR